MNRRLLMVLFVALVVLMLVAGSMLFSTNPGAQAQVNATLTALYAGL